MDKGDPMVETRLVGETYRYVRYVNDLFAVFDSEMVG